MYSINTKITHAVKDKKESNTNVHTQMQITCFNSRHQRLLQEIVETIQFIKIYVIDSY